MKKDLFWKIIVSLFIVWLFLFLWMNQWHYGAQGLIKTSRLTGKTYNWDKGEWKLILE